MSRSTKQPYRRSRRFDASCRCHGGCPWCYGNRQHRHAKQLARAACQGPAYEGDPDGWDQWDQVELEIYLSTQMYSDELYNAWRAQHPGGQ